MTEANPENNNNFGGKRIPKETWISAERDYFSGGYTLVELSEKYNVSVTSISKRAKRYNWEKGINRVNRRVKKIVREKINEVVTPYIEANKEEIERFFVSEMTLNKRHYEAYEDIMNSVEKMLSKGSITASFKGKDFEKKLDLSDYKTIVEIVSKIQSGQRICVGVDKPSDGSNTTNNNLFLDSETKDLIKKSIVSNLQGNIKMVENLVNSNISE